ncbi:Surfeit locus protein 4-like protein [Smittium culicis]|uniref:Surfeit locus protein 4-like protein n=1 Tax=Smittium culicis TaxID=133412 RepID=A0A1R1X9C3_9FUNG|nr:Surfeit locus protein 4-like protein [Smittium culicis]OMJ27141.1 Surfeit locus protein 4-like protein [Smittium culicis]
MESVRKFSEKFETYLDLYSRQFRPYLPILARTLLVSTFIEDAFRIIFQWSNQLFYLRAYRGFPNGLNHIFLAYNVIVMLICSTAAISRKHTLHSVIGLLTIVVGQGFAYGLIFDFSFFMRNLSVIGGLLILLAESLILERKEGYAGIPNISEADRTRYVLLGGRILLVFLFFSMLFSSEFSLLRIILIAIGGLSCIMVAVGFKAKYSAMMLVAVLSVFNLIVNDWWSFDSNSSHRDFVKYDFFQTLSIMGGFLLIVNIGPGSFSVDEKKKDY